jgi:transposase
VDHRQQIRQDYCSDGTSIRRIAREGHFDRRTITKALRDTGPPRYTLREPWARPVLAPFVAHIDRWLKNNLAHPPKQRHTARRIFERLVAERGFRGGESTVLEYVSTTGPSASDIYIWTRIVTYGRKTTTQGGI